ncbi:hypothetical protein ACF09C_22705 [Streptomyces sp. NPDC014870]|uniref:hypothetical protein n=1 Tax=Streptomyces sp. NPDC014870 TaxID=3364925 RepID=UPI0036FE152D
MTDRTDGGAALVDEKALLALAEGHHARTARAWGAREAGGQLVKVYAIEAPGRTVGEAELAPALRIAADQLALGRRSGALGLAVLILHAGGDGDYVLVHSWIEGHMSELAIWTGPAGRPEELRPGRAGLAPCVWEAAVLAHEREAFVRQVLDGSGTRACPADHDRGRDAWHGASPRCRNAPIAPLSRRSGALRCTAPDAASYPALIRRTGPSAERVAAWAADVVEGDVR